MNSEKTLICWTPGTNDIALVPSVDPLQRKRKYLMHVQACGHNLPLESRKAAILTTAIHMIVRDRCSPLHVHKVLLGLVEYRSLCACDMPGAVDAMRAHGEQTPGWV